VTRAPAPVSNAGKAGKTLARTQPRWTLEQSMARRGGQLGRVAIYLACTSTRHARQQGVKRRSADSCANREGVVKRLLREPAPPGRLKPSSTSPSAARCSASRSRRTGACADHSRSVKILRIARPGAPHIPKHTRARRSRPRLRLLQLEHGARRHLDCVSAARRRQRRRPSRFDSIRRRTGSSSVSWHRVSLAPAQPRECFECTEVLDARRPVCKDNETEPVNDLCVGQRPALPAAREIS